LANDFPGLSRKPEAQRGGQRRASLIVCDGKICDFMMVTRQVCSPGLPAPPVLIVSAAALAVMLVAKVVENQASARAVGLPMPRSLRGPFIHWAAAPAGIQWIRRFLKLRLSCKRNNLSIGLGNLALHLPELDGRKVSNFSRHATTDV